MRSKVQLILYIIAIALCPIALGLGIWFVVKSATLSSILSLVLISIGAILIITAAVLTIISRKKEKKNGDL